ncbi:branched-chain amino acid ABC transporter permease [Brachybacterium sp. AOP35-5H-19]|uniref:branched-chain amino acid ABC transporter permease n=1 Tax=Brachybacterium sp. AOP35-5H-19 TaxID=3457685 RepID=UPI0040334970
MFLGRFYLDVMANGIIYGIMALGLAWLIGRAGLPSLGHAGFAGVGGYAAALTAQHLVQSPQIGLLVAAVVGGAIAALLGFMTLRSSGVYFLMISLAFAELLHTAAIRTRSVGGDNGFTPPSMDVPLFGAMGLPRVVAQYWWVLLIGVIVYLLLRVLAASPSGDALLGSKDNADRMRALGYSVRALRMSALIVSGVLVAVGGALLTQKDSFISPDLLGVDVSILLLVIVLVGGTQSLLGPFLAGIGMVLMRSWISSTFGDLWVLILGAIFVLTVYLLPSGFAQVLRPRRAATSTVVKEEPNAVA